jgi:hypothetical protein
VDSNAADVALFKRENILDTAAPYKAMRAIWEALGLTGPARIVPLTPLGPFPAQTDLLFMARAGTPSAVEVEFELLLVEV